MKSILVALVITLPLFADYSCTSAGSDIEQYSREYDDALDEYENAITQDDKESAYDDMQAAKENLDSAVNSALTNCENSQIYFIVNLRNENTALKKENKQLKIYIQHLQEKISLLSRKQK